MHAFLIVGGSKEKRSGEVERLIKDWQVQTFDRIVIAPEGQSLTIGQVRDMASRLQLTPYQSPLVVGVIYDAHFLTLPAQAALLKTLEEPPLHARIILEAEIGSKLLSTIISRCQIIDLGNTPNPSAKAVIQALGEIDQLLKAEIGNRLVLIEPLAKTREEALAWVDLAVAALHQLLLAQHHSDPSGQQSLRRYFHLPTTKLIRRLLLAQSQLTSNVTPKLVLDNIFL